MTVTGDAKPARKARKRADGEGSIRWHKARKLFVARIMVGYRPDGKPDIREVKAKHQGECRKKLDAIKARMADGRSATRRPAARPSPHSWTGG